MTYRTLTNRLLAVLCLAGALAGACTSSSRAATDIPSAGYRIQPGDVLLITVWKEEDLQRQVLVRPDGGISFPLAGDLQAEGKTAARVQAEIATRLERYIPEPAVTVALADIEGNTVYVIGKVNQPGAYLMKRRMDVMQALSVAGGTSTFAALNDIKILRRTQNGQVAIPFRYGDVEDGDNLEQNILLQSGDVVVVP